MLQKCVNAQEVRLSVWRAVRNLPNEAINLTDWPFRIAEQGIVVYEDEAHLYCDGRSPARLLGDVGQRRIVFLPFVPQPDDLVVPKPPQVTTALVRVT